MNKPADCYLDVPAGKAVFVEGEQGQVMYVIESGAIDLLHSARGEDPVVALGAGEFFGEMAMFEDQPRPFSAIAREPARLLRIERSAFADLLRQNVEIALKLMHVISRRHQRSEYRLSSILADSANARRKPASVPAPTASAPPAAKPVAAKEAPKPAAPRDPGIEPAPAPVQAAAAKAAGSCVLRHAQGEIFPLDPARTEFLVGRPDPVAGINPEINLSGVDPTRSLSRRHAKLVRQGRLYFVREDAATVNGTFVNNVRVTTGVDVPIKPGDKLRFGAVEVDFAAA